MRCKACNCNLSDFESTRQYADGEYIDLCSHCLFESDYEGTIIERDDLRTLEEDDLEWVE